MNAVAIPDSGKVYPTWRCTVHWLVAGLRLLRRAPLAVFALSVSPIVVEALLQTVPTAGVVVSKLLTPFAMAWALAMLDAKARHGVFDTRSTSRRWAARLPALSRVALLAAAVFVFQLALTALIAGPAQAGALAMGQLDVLELSRVQLAAIFVSGMLVSTPLMFVMPRVLLDGIGITAAIRESIAAVWRHRRPVAVLTVSSAALVASVLWWPWVLLVVLPLVFCVGYAAYRDVFDGAAN